MYLKHFLRGADETMVNEASETSPVANEVSGRWRKAHRLLDIAEYTVNKLRDNNATNTNLRYFAKA